MSILTNVKNALTVTLVLAVAILMSFAAPAKAGTAYSGGSGTSGDPFQIGTTADWVHLTETSSDWGDYFILTADLNFGGATIQPIGDGGCDFQGSFDGNDHVVSNARIARPNTETYLIGLFGLVGSTGLVKDLGAEDITLVCRTMSGVLTGQNEGTITNCYAVGGSISFTSSTNAATKIGGLVGSNYFGTITDCFADVDISINGKNSQEIGGLVGYLWESTINRSCATGSVTISDTSSQSIGGLVGYIGNSSYQNRCVLQDCYASGAVSGVSGVGGLVGMTTGGGGMTLSNCYAIGSITGTTWTGGLVGAGFTGYEDIVTASYWNTQTSGQDSSSVGTARTTDPMTYPYAADTYQSWDFSNVWTADTQNKNGGYPYLKWQVLKAPADIRLEGNAVEIANGDSSPSSSDHTDFGNADLDSDTIIRTFTVKNTGDIDLTLSGNPRVAVSGTHSADFSVTAQPSATVSAGSSTTFQVAFNPSSTGVRTASLSIASSDADENPYTFSVQGTGLEPIPVWLTFLGGSGNDFGMEQVVDASGNVYITGYCTAAWGSNPVRAYSSDYDAFVAKVNGSGTLQWFTFLGGGSQDTGQSIALDAGGNVYVTGQSCATWGSPVQAFTGAGDVFVAKLNGSGALQWHTFLGGSGVEAGYDLALDSTGNIYVTGTAYATWGSPVRAYTDRNDAFVAKLNSSGALQWHTFLGGSLEENGYALDLDTSGNIFVTGSSYNWGSPVLSHSGATDGFVAKLNNSGALQWNTFMGGSGFDEAWSVATDSSDNVYVGGFGNSSWGSPIHAYSGSNDAFVVKFDNSGALQWHTFLGSSSSEIVYGLALDSSGSVYITGNSGGTWGTPVQAYTKPGETYVAKIDSSGVLRWNTFMGGSGTDIGQGLAVDGNGNVFVTGYSDATWSNPIRAYTSSNDAFVVKLNSKGQLVPAPEMSVEGNSVEIASGDTTPSASDHTDFGTANVTTGSVTRTFTIKNTGAADLTLSGDPKVTVYGTHATDFTVTSQPASPVAVSGGTTFTVEFVPSAAGTRTATVSITNNDSNETPYTFSVQGGGIGSLTVSGITALNKVYDGNTTATLNTDSAHLEGITPGDNVTLVKTSVTGTFSDKHVSANKTVSISGLSLDGADKNHYTLIEPVTTAAITARPLTVHVTSVDKVYDGTATANVTLSDDRLAGDVLTTAYTAADFTDKHVGTNKTVSVTGISLSGADVGNYNPNTTASTSANITARTLTVTAVIDSKVYDGDNASSAAPTVTFGSLAAGDTVTWTQSFDTRNAGVNKTITPAGIVNDGNSGNNYNVTYTPVTTGEITVKILPVTGITALNKVYDGTNSATIDMTNVDLTGVVAGDNVTLDTDAAIGLFSGKAGAKDVGTDKTVIVSGIVLEGSDAGNYDIDITNPTADITAKELTVTGITASDKVYNGTTGAAIDTGSAVLVGVVDSEDVTLDTSAATGNFTGKTVGTNQTVTITGLALSGADIGNYTLTQPTTTADITTKALAVTATGADKVYDGTNTASVTLSDDRVAGDDLATDHTTANFTDKHVGNGKTITITGISISGADAGNYTPNTTTTTTANITARPITVTAVSDTKVYDGTANSTGTPTLTSRLIKSPPPAALAPGDSAVWTQSFDTRNAGINKTITPAGTISDGNNGNNYNVTWIPVTTGVITAKGLTVTGITASDKVYDGTTAAPLDTTKASLVGAVGGDDVTLDKSAATGNFTDKHIGTEKAVSVSGLTLDGVDKANYTLIQPTTEADITKRPVTITAVADEKVYDGTANSTGTPVLTSGLNKSRTPLHDALAPGDTAEWSQSFDTKHAGTGKTLTPAGTISDGNSGNNYDVTCTSVDTGTISKRPVIVTAVSDTKVYNGDTSSSQTPAISYDLTKLAVPDALVGGDTADLTQSFDTKHAGTGKTLTPTGTISDGNNGNNYDVTWTPVNTGTISKRPITVTAVSDTKVYDGTADSTGTPTLTSRLVKGPPPAALAPGDSAEWTQSFDTRNAGTNKTITPAGTISDGNNGKNYDVTWTPVTTGEIIVKGLTVTGITASDRVYNGTTGAAIDTTGALLAGAVGGDDVTLDKSAAAGNFSDKHVGTDKTVSVSGLTLDGVDKANYTLTQPTTTADITTKELTVNGVTANDKVYNGNTTATLDTAGASLVGTVGGDDVTLVTGSAAGAFDNKGAGTDKSVTVSGLTLNGADKTNYTLTQPAMTADITPRALAVTAAGIDKVYDGTIAATVNLNDDRVAGDTLTVTYTTAVFADKHTGTNKTVDVAGIAVSGADAGNYTPNTTAATTADVTVRPVTVTAVTDNRTYDGSVNSAAVPVITLGSLAAGDNATWTQTFDDKTTGTNKTLTPAGTVDDGNGGNNYNVTCTPVTTGTITEKELTVTGITASDKINDGHTGATLDITNAFLNGVVPGDNVTLDTTNVTGNFTDDSIGNGKTVLIVGLTLNGTDTAYYFLTQPTTTASILAQPGGGGGFALPKPKPEPETDDNVWVIAVVDTTREPLALDDEGNVLPVTGGLITVSENQTKLMVNIPVELEEGKKLDSFTDTAGLTFSDNRLEIDASAAAPDGKALLRIVDETGDLGTKIIIETGECCGVGDKAVAEVLSVKSNCGYTFSDLTGDDPSVGVVASTVSLDLNTLPEDAEVKITTSKYPDPAAGSAFQLAASEAGMDDITIAYTINVEKTNIRNGTDIESASIIMAAGKDWVEANGGIEKVRIIRFDAETGQQQVLETRFLGYDAEGRAVFEGVSPDGLSVFGLTGVQSTNTAIVPAIPAAGEPKSEPAFAPTVPVSEEPASASSEAPAQAPVEASAETAGENSGNQWLPALIGFAFIIPLAVCFFVVTRKRKKKPTGYLERISKQANRIFGIMSDIDAVAAGTNLAVIDIAISTVKERETNATIALAAEKLRKLSEQTAAITVKIVDTNTAVRQSLEKLLFSIRKEDETKTDGYTARVEENLAELDTILRQVTQVLTEIKIISRGSKEIMNGMTTMKNSKQESHTREATSKNILEGIQEMHDRAETIREITEYLAKMSDKLND